MADDLSGSANRAGSVRATVLDRKPRWLRLLVWTLLLLGFADIINGLTRAGRSLSLNTGSVGLMWLGVTSVTCTAIFAYDRESLKPAVLDALFYVSLVVLLSALLLRAVALLRVVAG
jgi:hypothetical protein